MTSSPATMPSEFDSAYAAEQVRRSRHPLRRLIKGFYLRNILRDVRGVAIDFGCGAGQLLHRMPPGSLGLEVNPHLIRMLRASGLQVLESVSAPEAFELRGIESGAFRTVVVSHVLEHLPEPLQALETLFAACRRVGVDRVVVVVPGRKGFASDRTHQTFVDRSLIAKLSVRASSGFVLTRTRYFPLPWEWVGRFFVFHEMKAVFDCMSLDN